MHISCRFAVSFTTQKLLSPNFSSVFVFQISAKIYPSKSKKLCIYIYSAVSNKCNYLSCFNFLHFFCTKYEHFIKETNVVNNRLRNFCFIFQYYPRNARSSRDAVLLDTVHSVPRLKSQLARMIINEYNRYRYNDWPNFQMLYRCEPL